MEVDRRQFEVPESIEKVYLTKDQNEALIQIKNGFKQKFARQRRWYESDHISRL